MTVWISHIAEIIMLKFILHQYYNDILKIDTKSYHMPC